MADLGIPGGVRITHADGGLAGKTLVVPTARRYAAPRACGRCTPGGTAAPTGPVVWHDRKHLHIKLDGERSAIVSHTVLERLREVGMAGFTVESEVDNPPAQSSADYAREVPHTARPAEGDVADAAPVGALVIG